MQTDSRGNSVTEIQASMTFSRTADVQADPARSGMLRATTQPMDVDQRQDFELHSCRVQDWSAENASSLNLETMGFDTIDLSSLEHLQTTLETVRNNSHITRSDAYNIRKQLAGRTFKLTQGKRLRLLVIAPEGLIMRKAGPNGCQVAPDEVMTEMNGHDGALTVHADQDVRGTPLKQIFKGAAPWVFRHQSPDSRNRFSPIFLLNIWVPLQQISRPLTLMDRRSLDKHRHQLCYALPTDKFLDRDEAKRVNDIWMFLYDDSQQWYFNTEMDSSRAYVFDTLGTPHGSVILPGEVVAEQLFQRLGAACQAVIDSDNNALKQALEVAAYTLPANTTAPLRRAIQAMQALLDQAQQQCQQGRTVDKTWCALASLARDKVVRKSIEMRAVAMLTPDVWPFNRR